MKKKIKFHYEIEKKDIEEINCIKMELFLSSFK